MSNLVDVLRGAIYAKPAPTLGKATLDGATANDDVVFDSAEGYELAAIAQQAVSAIQQWAETDDLDAGETMANRLMGLFVGIADANKDGELDDDEQEVVEAALSAAWDYLESLGVAEEDISALLLSLIHI